MAIIELSLDSTRHLVQQCRGGDESAFAALVVAYQSAVFGTVLRLVRDREVAAEVSNRAFFKAYEHLASFDESRPLRAWLLRIAANEALNAMQCPRNLAARCWDTNRYVGHGRCRRIVGLSMIIPLSILDLAPIRPGQSASDSFSASVALAQHAEELGYRRVWYAEHHNIPTIASSATSVLIAHVAALTRTIRVGAGGIMLPNHAPLTIAEQFGTLEALHPGRIDLGLGRAPGSDQNTMHALRRYVASADSFPQDVLELQGYLGSETRIPGVNATPGKGTHVPLYILGSSMFGAELAALLGLPFAFASHFAPDALQDAVAAYRREFRPSAQLDQPYVIAGMNVIAADTSSEAQRQYLGAKRNRVTAMLGRGRTFTDEEADMILDSPAGQQVQQMFRIAAVGTPAEVREYITAFARYADADELIVAHQSLTTEARLRSVALLADSVRHTLSGSNPSRP